MKNTTTNISNHMNFLKKAILILLFAAPVSTVIAQKKSTFGIRAYAGITGSGHGVAYTPSLFYRHNRTMVSAGPVISGHGNEVAGIEGSYEYALTGACRKMALNYYNERTELFVFGSVLYRPGSLLSQSAIEMEKTSEMRSNPYERLRVRTLEGYAGFGLKVTILKGFQWANSIGIGGYVSPDSPSEIYRQQSAACMLMRTGLYYSFSK